VTILVRLMDWGCDRCGPWETKVQKLGVNKKFSLHVLTCVLLDVQQAT
jgi:hypothetical protein